MRKLKELNTKSFKKKVRYFIDEEIEFSNEEEKKAAQSKIQSILPTRAAVNRDRVYHIDLNDKRVQLRYRKRTAEPLR